MKYKALVTSHITVDAKNLEQAKFRVNTVISKMLGMFEEGEVGFYLDGIDNYFQSPTYGELRHQPIDISNLKSKDIFAFWNNITDTLYLIELESNNSWIAEKWVNNKIISKFTLDNDTVIDLINDSNNYDPTAIGYVIGMEYVAPKTEILSVHVGNTLIGYKSRKDDNNDD